MRGTCTYIASKMSRARARAVAAVGYPAMAVLSQVGPSAQAAVRCGVTMECRKEAHLSVLGGAPPSPMLANFFSITPLSLESTPLDDDDRAGSSFDWRRAGRPADDDVLRGRPPPFCVPGWLVCSDEACCWDCWDC